jgi:hypothetical protein
MNLQGSAKSYQSERILFARRPLDRFGCSQIYPWFAHRSPEKKKSLAMWPLRARGGTTQCNPARPTAGLTGEDVERGVGVPRTRFVGLIGAGSRLEDAVDGARRRAPLELGLRRGGSAARATRRCGSSIRS